MRKKVFVAYSYRLYTGDEYRACFSRIGTKYGVDFIFADSRIATEQIFEKIRKMIRESIFSMFDISDWNPNVTLELGFASGIGHPWFILVNPSKSTGGVPEVPADLRGFDRIQYDSLEALEAGLSKLMDQLFGREGLLSPSIGDVIRDHVFATLDRFISERSWASDRDTTVAILPNGPILPLESEVIIEELPSYVWRFPPDPFHPSSPVGLWITSLLGKLVGVCIAVCVAVELVTIVYVGIANLQAVGALLVTLPVAGWFLSSWRKRRAFESQNPYSMTYHRPRERSVGPYFVWRFAEPADPEDPRLPARVGDSRAVGVELKWRSARGQNRDQMVPVRVE
ncbi:MAG: hypothetical protein ACLPU9_01270 [Thermoplasmata archaeon]